MYNPPQCDQINFSIGGIYTPSSCLAINFSFIVADHTFSSDYTEIGIIGSDDKLVSGIFFTSDNSEFQIQTSNNNIEIVKEFVQSIDEILIQCSSINIGKPNPYNLPTGLDGGIVFSWKTPEKTNTHTTFPWNESKHLIKIIDHPFTKQEKIENNISSSWKTMEYIYTKNNIVFDKLEELNNHYSVSFIYMDIFDIHTKITWKENEISDSEIKIVYFEPGPKDNFTKIVYDDFYIIDENSNISYKQPGPKDKHEHIPWGPFSYYTLCNGLTYYPPEGCEIKFNFPNKYQLTPDICEGIRFNISSYSTDPRCPYDHWHTGIRDAGSGILTITPTEYPKDKKSYYMFNEIYVEEVVTQNPIEVISVDAKIDINSWLWSFNITIADKCYLDLIKPINGIMGHLKIRINTYEWYCSVEGWSESRSFGSQSWTITGRSPAMMFGSPISQKTSGSVSTAKQGQTIIEEIVQAKQLPPNWPTQFETWASDFEFYNTTGNVSTGFKPYVNWYIPENTVNYTDKTEIEIITELSSAAGMYVQAHRNLNKLIFKPLYPHQPWTWEISNTNIDWNTISESQIKEVGRSNSLKPFYQAVHVIGESIGGSNTGDGSDPSNTAIFVDVRRDEYGPSTASYAPMITNPYVTSSKVALELGRMQIAQTSEWLNHTLRLGILCSDQSSPFKLYEVGDMVAILERGSTWRGQVIGVGIIAASSGGGFAVNQTIEVQEYRGE